MTEEDEQNLLKYAKGTETNTSLVAFVVVATAVVAVTVAVLKIFVVVLGGVL